jgi:hypothetical protein
MNENLVVSCIELRDNRNSMKRWDTNCSYIVATKQCDFLLTGFLRIVWTRSGIEVPSFN